MRKGLCCIWSAIFVLGIGGVAYGQEPNPVEEIEYLFPWAISMPEAGQIEEVRECDIETMVESRYGEFTSLEDMRDAHTPETPCEWAILAVAYASLVESYADLPDFALDAFTQAITANPAFLFDTSIFTSYSFAPNLVAPPPFEADNPVTELTVHYSYAGIGGSAPEWEITIQDADTDQPVVNGWVDAQLGDNEPAVDLEESTIAPTLVQALPSLLTNLFPIQRTFQMLVCYDNYPDWSAEMTFADGTRFELLTVGSNYLYGGGPWQAKISGTYYMQFGFDLLQGMFDIREALQLPPGETAAMTCGGFDDSPLNMAFPPVSE